MLRFLKTTTYKQGINTSKGIAFFKNFKKKQNISKCIVFFNNKKLYSHPNMSYIPENGDRSCTCSLCWFLPLVPPCLSLNSSFAATQAYISSLGMELWQQEEANDGARPARSTLHDAPASQMGSRRLAKRGPRKNYFALLRL